MPTESACWKHICRPLEWNVIPSEPASCNEFICLQQIGEECSLPRFYFLHEKIFGCKNVFLDSKEKLILFWPQTKIKTLFFLGVLLAALRLMKKIEKSDWTTLLIALSDNINFQNRGVVNRMSLPEILKAIQQKIGSDQENTFMINEADQEISAEVGNEWDELVLDDLDPEDRSEFRELKEAIDAKRAETFQEHWAIIRKSMTATRRRGRPKKEGEEKRKVKVKGNNVKVKRKWLKRRRPRKPLEDEEELKPKKQKTFEKSSDQPEDEDVPQLFEANHHHAAQEVAVSTPEDILLSSSNAIAASGMASVAEQQDMASELAASSSTNDIVLSTSGRTPFSEDQDMMSSELAASQAAPNGVLSNEGSENAVSSTLDIVAPLPHQVPSEAPRSPGGVSQVSMNSRAGQHRPSLLW